MGDWPDVRQKLVSKFGLGRHSVTQLIGEHENDCVALVQARQRYFSAMREKDASHKFENKMCMQLGKHVLP
jgi:hypothetical protein